MNRAHSIVALAVFACALTARSQSNTTTVAAYLAAQPKPAFKPGHTLLPLTRFGWTLPFEARVELARNWGYALEFGGYATEEHVQKALANPDSIESKLCALTASDPKRFPLAVIVSRNLPRDVPPETWTRDAQGVFLDRNAQPIAADQAAKSKGRLWSPEAPDSVFREAGRLRADPLRKIREKCPIAVILNGGEYAMTVEGFGKKAWEKDPRVMAAKGGKSWFEYLSQSKARHEMFIADAIRQAVPDRSLYVYYTTGGGTHRDRTRDWSQWCWGYEWMHGVSDLPSNEMYYREFNDGWSGANDMLTMILNAAAFEIERGHKLSYNWLCAGYSREKMGEQAFGDLNRYAGFLKCYYTAGMIGGVAGYFAYPKGGFQAAFPADAPPHWLRQMIVHSQTHALFTHLEGFLRQGDLLPSPNRHRFSKNSPAHEFPTGDANVRVLSRKLKGRPEWIITAWAASGPDRKVTVAIPELGQLKLNARDCGSVYHAKSEAGGQPALRLVDEKWHRESSSTKAQ